MIKITRDYTQHDENDYDDGYEGPETPDLKPISHPGSYVSQERLKQFQTGQSEQSKTANLNMFKLKVQEAIKNSISARSDHVSTAKDAVDHHSVNISSKYTSKRGQNNTDKVNTTDNGNDDQDQSDTESYNVPIDHNLGQDIDNVGRYNPIAQNSISSVEVVMEPGDSKSATGGMLNKSTTKTEPRNEQNFKISSKQMTKTHSEDITSQKLKNKKENQSVKFEIISKQKLGKKHKSEYLNPTQFSKDNSKEEVKGQSNILYEYGEDSFKLKSDQSFGEFSENVSEDS